MRIDLGVIRAEGTNERRVFECKSMALCKTRYGTREHKNGCSWADRRGALAIKERTDQAQRCGGRLAVTAICDDAPTAPTAAALAAEMQPALEAVASGAHPDGPGPQEIQTGPGAGSRRWRKRGGEA